VLIECGFLSNPEEEAKLRSDGYQKSLCALIAATVSNFLDG
jgi:N-acetylmuramoyl-L-alanine amidase